MPARTAARAIPPKRLWKMRVHPEAVEACLENAVDLTEDAKRCKSPAGVALAELSLEQASLTALLWGRYQLDKNGITDRLQRGEVCLPPNPTSLALVAICGDLGSFSDPEIIEASWDHDASVRHVETALRFLERLAPYLFDPENPPKYPSFALRFSQRLALSIVGRERFARRGRAEFEAFIKRARAVELPRLPEVKKETLYARVDRETGTISIPEEADGQFESIIEVAVLIEDVVAGALETELAVAANKAKVQKVLAVVQRIDSILNGPRTSTPRPR